MVRFFGSEVRDLEPVLALLQRCDAQEQQGSMEGLWQAQCTLLLQLLLIPFPLATVDSSADDSQG